MDSDLPGNSNSGHNISDILEVINTDIVQNMGQRADMVRRESPFIRIREQPASKALRFRYECEGRSAGSIPGVNSTPENKTFPTIEIVGYQGRAVVVVSCVTKEGPHTYKAHPHNLVGRDGCKRGVCTVEVNNESMTMSFDHLGIQCVKKKDIEDALKVREEIRVDPFRQGFAHRSNPSLIDLNAVRLCFQAFLENEPGKFKHPLTPVVSDIIYDKKALCDLAICKLSHCSASVAGGLEMILLCEKVTKDDISIVFFEEKNGKVVWEDQGEFSPTQVHKQVAITFRTPKYRSIQVEKEVKMFVQLRRPSDGETSDPVPFLMTPLDSGRPAFWSLRRYKPDYRTFSSILTADAKLLARVENSANVPSLPVESQPQATIVDNLVASQDSNNNSEPVINAPLVTTSLGISADYSALKKKEPQKNVFSISQQQMEIQIQEPPPSQVVSTVTQHSVHFSDDINPVNNNYTEEVQQDETKTFDDVIDLVDNAVQQSFDELIDQVGDFDDDMMDSDLNNTDIVGTVNDGIYSSFQMAMKNPFEFTEYNTSGYEDVIPPRPSAAKPVVTDAFEPETESYSDDILPPLPPKRIRKSPPRKTLPPVPEAKKLNIFQKLFLSKRKEKVRKNSVSSMDSKQLVVEVKAEAESIEPDVVTLTEAEHYALYTALAPHATASEFDETSFYYSPVEGQTQVVK